MGFMNSAQQIFVEAYAAGGWFPVLFGCVAVTLVFSALFNSRFVMQLGLRRVSHAAILGFCATTVLHLAIDLAFGQPPLPVFVGLLALTLFCFGLIVRTSTPSPWSRWAASPGTASSFFGAVTTGVGAVLGLWIGQQYDGSVTPLLAGFAAFGLAGLAIVLVTERGSSSARPPGRRPPRREVGVRQDRLCAPYHTLERSCSRARPALTIKPILKSSLATFQPLSSHFPATPNLGKP